MSAFDRTQNSAFECYTTVVENWLPYFDKVDKLVTGTTYTLNSSEALQWESNYTWRLYAVDVAGNPGSYSALRNFTVRDQTAPSTPGAPDLSSSSDSGFSSTDNITNDKTPTFSWVGSTDAGSGIAGYEYRLGSSAWTSTGNQTSTTVTLPSLSDGSYSLSIRANDAGRNNSGASNSISFTVDTVAPSKPTLSSPLRGDNLNSTTANLEWNAASDSGSGIHNYQLTYETSAIGDERTVNVSGTTSQLTGLAHVRWFWRVSATDRAGNPSITSDEWNFTIQQPQITSARWEDTNGNPLSGTVNEGTTLYLAVYASGFPTSQSFTADVFENDLVNDPEVASNRAISYVSSGKWRGDWTAQYRSDISGDPEFYFKVDGYSLTSADINVRDATAPGAPLFDSASSSHQPNLWSKSDDLDIWWTAPVDASGIAGYSVLVNNSSSGTPDTTSEGSVRRISLANQADTSSLYVHVRAVDIAGNWSSSVARFGPFMIDATAPGQPGLLSPLNGAPLSNRRPGFDWTDVSDSGSGLRHYEVEVYDGDVIGNDISATTANSNFTPSQDLQYDTFSWKIRALDQAGNFGVWSTVQTFSILEPRITAIRWEDAAGNSLPNGAARNTGETVYIEVDTQGMRGTNATLYLYEDDGFFGGDDLIPGTITVPIPTNNDTWRIAWTVPYHPDSDFGNDLNPLQDIGPEYRLWNTTAAIGGVSSQLLDVPDAVIKALRWTNASGTELPTGAAAKVGEQMFFEVQTQNMRGQTTTIYLYEDDGVFSDDEQLQAISVSIPAGADVARIPWSVTWNPDPDFLNDLNPIKDVAPEYRLWSTTALLGGVRSRLLDVFQPVLRWETASGSAIPTADAVPDGTTVYLSLSGIGGLSSTAFTAFIYENDPTGDALKAGNIQLTYESQGRWRGTWVASWEDDGSPFDLQPDYYFTANAFAGLESADLDVFPWTIRNEAYNVDLPDKTKETWLVVHGRNDDPNGMRDVVDALKSVRNVGGLPQDAQIFTLDWKQLAYGIIGIPGIAGPSDLDFTGENFIAGVGSEAAGILESLGFVGTFANNLNLVGHSWGALVSHEIARNIADGVNRLIALDPAENAKLIVTRYPEILLPGTNYGIGYDTDNANFAHKTSYSIAFLTSVWGSSESADSADDSIVVEFIDSSTGARALPWFETSARAHSAVISLFSQILLRQSFGFVSDIFGIDRLNSSNHFPWIDNRYGVLDQLILLPGQSPLVTGFGLFDSVLRAAGVGGSTSQTWEPFSLTYFLASGEATIFEANGDTQPPALTGVMSQKIHGASGSFSLALSLAAVATVEPRLGGPTQVVFTFSEPIIPADGSLGANEFAISNGIFNAASISGTALTLSLTGIGDQSILTVALSGLTDLSGNPLTGDRDVSIRALYGDVNQSGTVLVSDVNVVRSRLLQSTTASNFLSDVNLNGLISVADVTQVKRNLLRSVPASVAPQSITPLFGDDVLKLTSVASPMPEETALFSPSPVYGPLMADTSSLTGLANVGAVSTKRLLAPEVAVPLLPVPQARDFGTNVISELIGRSSALAKAYWPSWPMPEPVFPSLFGGNSSGLFPRVTSGAISGLATVASLQTLRG